MATIGPITLTITPGNKSSNANVNVGYVVSANNHDLASGQYYREVCELIGDDTPGDGTDDVLVKLKEEVIVFDGPFTSFTRAIQQFVDLTKLDEDSGILALEEDEIRARVTLTPIPTSRESNLVLRGGPVISKL
jgi:hypothetical protein